tara:strand:- start:112 stop:285 length:174 start_codon:yes stop_codon:yes gene_type:complete
MTLTPDELAERVAERYDPDIIVEVLGISSRQLIDAFFEEFIEKRDKFKDEEETYPKE